MLRSKTLGDLNYMTKWNIFGKSKSKKVEPQNYPEPEEPTLDDNMQFSEDEQLNFEETQTDKPIADYHETLNSGKTGSNKKSSQSTNTYSDDQRVWRDIKAIEENIDNMRINTSHHPTSEFDKKVDKLIKKTEKK